MDVAVGQLMDLFVLLYKSVAEEVAAVVARDKGSMFVQQSVREVLATAYHSKKENVCMCVC